MHRRTFAAVLLVLFTTVVSSQSGVPPSVRVVNLPPIQPVTGDELVASQELLTLLLVHSYGVLPPGHSAPEGDRCLITGIGEIYVTEEVIPTDPPECDLETYAAACASAAQRSRSECQVTCEQFDVLGGHRQCRGHARPIIEPFFPARHCFSTPEHRTLVTCVVTAWCSCDP